MRYLLSFLSGALALALTQRAMSDRTNSYRPLGPRRIESRVTIQVKEDPTKTIPEGEFSSFLENVVGLKEAERKQILTGAALGFISEVRIERTTSLSADESDTRGITFDVIDGKFSRHAGIFHSHFGPRLKPADPFQLKIPVIDPAH